MSAGVVALISTLLLVSSLAARRESLVRRAAEEFAGFLRETSGLALNGVKAPGCGTEAACSIYVVRYQRNSRRYTRWAAFNQGATVTEHFLPPGALFRPPTGTVRFRFTPPTLTLTTRPVSPPVIQIRYGRTNKQGWQVCVTKSASVVVLKEGLVCPP